MHPSVKIAIPAVLATICLVLSGSIIIAGYLVPATQNQGYTPRICTCGVSYINQQPINAKRFSTKHLNPREDFIGSVDLTYNSRNSRIFDNVIVLTSTSYDVVKTYLVLNFKYNSTVLCYVSPGDNSIKVHLMSSLIALGFCAAFGILSVVFFLLTLACCCWNKHHKRSSYIELANKRRGDDFDILRN